MSAATRCLKIAYEKSCKNLLFVALLFNAFFLLSSYDVFNVAQNSDIFIYSYGNKNELSSSASVRLTSINSDGIEVKLSSISIPENFIYDPIYDDIIYEGVEEGKEAILPLHLEAAEDIILTFASNGYCGLIGIKDGDNYQEIDLYNSENSAYYYNVKSNIKYETFFDILIKYITVIGVVSIIVSGLILIINAVCKDKGFNKKICILATKIYLLNFLLLILTRYYLPLKFEILLSISSILLLGLVGTIHLKNLPEKFNIAIFVSSIWITFSLWGAVIFLPLGKVSLNIRDILIFLLLTVLIYRIIKKIIDVFAQGAQRFATVTSKVFSWFLKYKKVFIGGWLYVITVLIYYLGKSLQGMEVSIFWLFLLIFLAFLGYFFERKDNYFMTYFMVTALIMLPIVLIFNPANLTLDSFDQFGQIEEKLYSDHHPIMHTLLEQGILFLFHKIEAITIFQVLVFSFVNAKGAYYLLQKGVNENTIYFVLCLSALWPSTLINMVTLWKDIMFCVAILWLTILLAQMKDDLNGFFKNKLRIAETFIVLFVVGTFRHNGPFILAGLILILIFTFCKTKKFRNAILIVGMGVLVFCTKNAILSKLDVRANGSIVSVVLYHGLAYEKYEDIEVGEKTDKFLDSIMPIDLAKELYNPGSANPYMYTEIAKENNALTKFRESDLKEVLKVYLSEFLRNPYLLVKDRLYGTDLLWNVSQGKDSYNYMYAADVEANDLGIARKYTPFESIAKAILRMSENYDVIFWRGGIYMDILIILLIVGCIIGLKNIVLIFWPTILNVVSLFLSMAWQDYRYVWFLWLVVPFIFSCVVLIPRETKNEEIQKQE